MGGGAEAQEKVEGVGLAGCGCVGGSAAQDSPGVVRAQEGTLVSLPVV